MNSFRDLDDPISRMWAHPHAHLIRWVTGNTAAIEAGVIAQYDPKHNITYIVKENYDQLNNEQQRRARQHYHGHLTSDELAHVMPSRDVVPQNII